MDHAEATGIIARLYRFFLEREPASEEQEQWAGDLLNGIPVTSVIDQFAASPEYKVRHAVVPFFPNGHYHSPIVNPNADLRRYVEAQPARVGAVPHHIPMDAARMDRFVRRNAGVMTPDTIPSTPSPTRRFYAENGGFPLGDALVLRAMINHLRPARIIEVGSGFSTACMLDTLDELRHPAQITCVEPYPDRLLSLLRPGDRVEVFRRPVQDMPLSHFAELQSGDVLFIDSTHVVKTGSDVHYELFEILPRLRPGVVVHFHDIVYPFEYPAQWIFKDNYSWNESYVVRAFLMYNSSFSVFFSSSYMRQHNPAALLECCPNFPANPGTNLWLVKEA